MTNKEYRKAKFKQSLIFNLVGFGILGFLLSILMIISNIWPYRPEGLKISITIFILSIASFCIGLRMKDPFTS